MKNLNKKAQVGSMGPQIIALVIAGVFLILGLVMLQSMRDTDIIDQATSANIVNETVLNVTETGVNFAYAGLPAAVCSVTTVDGNNLTALRQGISSGNYTVSNCNIAFTGGDTQFNNTPWNITYTVVHGDEAYTSSNSTIVGLGTFSDFWEIIVLAIVITIVIGLLLAVFGGRRTR